MASIAVIAGSPSAPSRSTAVLRYLCQLIESAGQTVELMELRDLPAGGLLKGDVSLPPMQHAHALVAGAAGIIVGTPVYKATYSGLLKTFFDYLPESSLRGKSVYPVATGGSPAHMLAIDYGLKPVLSVMGASHILQGVYVSDQTMTIRDDGRIAFDAEIEDRLQRGLDDLLADVNRRVPAAQ
ncbi:MAG TPA: NADPH-dependent FMN reductase [Candidatus Acidoferrales bacterium]|nr:NADPH-dependent FMN reductase [Candidatus Acidoferrales bacterium]